MSGQAPSIFNDVIGPVMRGPSSSHVAGAARIGSLLRQAAGGELRRVTVDFDVNGSLAESHEGHGTDMGFACGILGLPLTDQRVDRYRELVSDSGIELKYRVLDYGAKHPNFYRIRAVTEEGKTIAMDAISTGGGMIEMVALNGIEVSILGDGYEYFYRLPEAEWDQRRREKLEERLSSGLGGVKIGWTEARDGELYLHMKLAKPLQENWSERLGRELGAAESYEWEPVLPTHVSFGCEVPFRTASELLEYNRDKNRELWELAVLYESERGGAAKEAVFAQMAELVGLMRQAAASGLGGTEYADRILPAQAFQMSEEGRAGRLIPGNVMNAVIQHITAIMEAKSAMKVIVAAPTAGSCGCLPGTLLGMAAALGSSEEDVVKAMLAAGLIGVFFAEGATFAAEVGGCQMECGAGSGMAAAGAAQMMGASAEECLDAASVALQGLTGLACDPVANRVEVPCLNKNIVGGMNALSSANMILSGFDKVIPLDETIGAMYDIGLKLPLELRCTFGGLGKTKSSLKIREQLENQKSNGT